MYFTSASSFFQSICESVDLVGCAALLKYPFYASLTDLLHQFSILLCLPCSHFVSESNSID